MYNPLIYPTAMPVVAAGVDNSRPSGAIMDDNRNLLVIDGTPIRVVVLAASAALAIMALRWSGFRFNVGVST
jgi:hypothetical protein